MKWAFRLLLAAALLASCVAVHRQSAVIGVVHAAPAAVTWRRQIAPLVYANCSGCHHAGGSGPFALASYADARRWGSQMETVTASRYMPPWLPAPAHGDFAGSRRMNDEQIGLLRAWVTAGMPEGDGPVPAAPVYSGEWQLGPPDLVLEMTAPLAVPAGGADLFHNVILPTGLGATRWVRAMEIQPGPAQVVHHANVILDRTASLRRAHPGDWQRGIPGMDILVDSGDSFDPDSHFLFWKPDSTALVEPAGMPWRLDAGNDLVLNLHLKPTGKAESVRARIGLYFTDKPATEHPMLLQLEHDAALDIPAGDAAFVVQDTLTLPVAVDVLGIYPHAHYLARRMEGWATLPTGERRWLVLIEDWDIDRQSVYRFRQPVALPKGSVVHMRYIYDNSAGNVRNPNAPPIRVRGGNRSADEMGHLWLQVLPRPDAGRDGRIALERAWMEARLRKDAGDDLALYNLASLEMMDGEPRRAVALYRRALERRPGDARAMTSLGSALDASGDWDAGRAQYRAAIARDPTYADAVFNLAAGDLRHNDPAEAETLFRSLVKAHPEDASARTGLGSALLAAGRTAEARAEFEQALAIAPDTFDALYGLARIEVDEEKAAAAEPLLLHALALRPDGDAERLLALAFAGSGEMERALTHLQAWQRLAPAAAEPHRALAQVLSQMGRKAEAVREQRAVVALSPGTTADWNDLGVLEARNGDAAAARAAFRRGLQIDPSNEALKGNLRRAEP